MSVYYFDLVKGAKTLIDTRGVELLDLGAARDHALAEARNIMQRDQSYDRDRSFWTFEIADEKGAYALTVPFSDALSDDTPDRSTG